MFLKSFLRKAWTEVPTKKLTKRQTKPIDYSQMSAEF